MNQRREVDWDQQQVAYDFPLRPDMIVRIVLPARLTVAEAGRITRFVEALAMPEEETNDAD